MLQHYDQIKAVDGDSENLTWNDIETYAGVSNDSASGLQTGDKVPMGTGEGTVNSDGSISYTIGVSSDSNPEWPSTLAATVLDLWGYEGPYSDEAINQTIAIIGAANPNVDMSIFPTGVELTIPGEEPSAEG